MERSIEGVGMRKSALHTLGMVNTWLCQLDILFYLTFFTPSGLILFYLTLAKLTVCVFAMAQSMERSIEGVGMRKSALHTLGMVNTLCRSTLCITEFIIYFSLLLRGLGYQTFL